MYGSVPRRIVGAGCRPRQPSRHAQGGRSSWVAALGNGSQDTEFNIYPNILIDSIPNSTNFERVATCARSRYLFSATPMASSAHARRHHRHARRHGWPRGRTCGRTPDSGLRTRRHHRPRWGLGRKRARASASIEGCVRQGSRVVFGRDRREPLPSPWTCV